MRGIDISNWQEGLVPSTLDIEFCICKATEGIDFVDWCCDGFIQNCIANGIPFGFYHFAGNDDPETEATFFMNVTKNYWGHGIPVLDWETNQSVNWVNRFVRKIYAEKGIWPWIYGNPWRFNQGGVEENCMRWIAAYPNILHPHIDYDPGEPPETEGLVGCWQFASDGVVPGYDGDLDIDIFYGDINAWNAYCGKPIVDNGENNKSQVLENDDYKITVERKR